MDREVAEWLAEIIQQTLSSLEHNPGLTIEVENDPANWVQVIPASDDVTAQLTGFILNMPFRDAVDEPEPFLKSTGINLPPNTNITSWERSSHIAMLIRPDIPLIALALLIGDLLSKVGNADDGFEINVQILHGL